jgi:prefoldin subunit 5
MTDALNKISRAIGHLETLEHEIRESIAAIETITGPSTPEEEHD